MKFLAYPWLVITLFVMGMPHPVLAFNHPTAKESSKIELMPSLSRPSIKNGEELVVMAIVKSAYPIVNASARINDLDVTIILKRTSGDAVAGMYRGTWVGEGLKEKRYQVVLSFTDSLGYMNIDRSLTFTDPLFGQSDPGSTSYPNANLRRVSALTLSSGEDNAFTGVIDSANGFAYIGLNTSPGKVCKVPISLDTLS
jgi:hypothetical protein